MKLTSPAFENNGFIPSKYTCDGEDINPPLKIEGVPEEAKSLVLVVDDPDAPMGTWDHWVVWNIESSVSEIKENEVPRGGVEGVNDFQKHSYGGPCPPSGIHHYHFKAYALSEKLDLSPSAKKDDVERAMQAFIIDKAELVGLYQKK
ncbi:MAG TPA: YbhB/YbcL family Raf kinase inhibitor-like protein [Candidatus Parcubacteria bacterium]|nr:YbhB/YbcL family Raf kinase inhibitor-like protein [Candidatus Parcubacteria bacterium]